MVLAIVAPYSRGSCHLKHTNGIQAGVSGSGNAESAPILLNLCQADDLHASAGSGAEERRSGGFMSRVSSFHGFARPLEGTELRCLPTSSADA